MEKKIYWKIILKISFIFFLISLFTQLSIDQIFYHYSSKIDGKIPIEEDVYGNRELQVELLNVFDVILAVSVGFVLMLAGITTSRKVEKNKILNAGITGAIVMMLVSVIFYIYWAYIGYRLSLFGFTGPIINLNDIFNLYDILTIFYAFVISVSGAFIYGRFHANYQKSKIINIKSTKSQAAMEFLMTYGWAILVVLVAVSTLAYFGVLSPDRFLPGKCQLPPGILCTGFKLNGPASQIALTIRNALGYDITNVNVWTSGCTDVLLTGSEGLITNGQSADPALNCNQGILISGSKYSGDLNITYTNANTGLTHKVRGTITGKVE